MYVFFRNYIIHDELLHEVCELCYSCSYCKRIRQMAARYRLVDCRRFNAVINQKKKQCFCLTFIITKLTFHSEKEKVTITSFSTCTSYTKYCLVICHSISCHNNKILQPSSTFSLFCVLIGAVRKRLQVAECIDRYM